MLHARERLARRRPCPSFSSVSAPRAAAPEPRNSCPMASNLSVSDSTPTPEIASSERVMWLLIWFFGILPVIWLLPVVYSWLRRRWAKTTAVAASASMISSSEAAMLEAAEQNRKRLQARVNSTLWQAGWCFMWFVGTPSTCTQLVRGTGGSPAMDITGIMGHYRYYWAGLPWAAFVLVCSADPTQSKRIISALHLMTWVALLLFLINMFGYLGHFRNGYRTLAFFLIAANTGSNLFLSISCAHALWRHKCIGGEQMPPRRMLHRIHLMFRWYFMWIGIVWAMVFFGRITCIKDGAPSDTCYEPLPPYAVSAASFFICSLFVMTPSNYGRFRRWLGSLGNDGSVEQKAASVASLLGGTSVTEALTNASARFRAQPLKALTLEALLTKESDLSLYANSVAAKLGEVHAFMSHSWMERRWHPQVRQAA